MPRGPDTPDRRRGRPRRARWRRRILVLLAAAALAAGGGVLALGRALETPYKGYAAPSVLLTVPPGSSSRAIAAALEEGGVVRDRRLLLISLRVRHRGATLKAGEYRFEGPLSPEEVLRPLLEGRVLVHRITLPEGLTAEEIFETLAARGFGDVSDYRALFTRPGEFEGVPRGAPTLEGFLFPATYDLTRPVAPRDVVRLLVRQFVRSLPDGYAARASERGLSLLGAVTLASMVEKETGVAAERPVVAAVYLNRLRIGMLLQCDPTTVYALRRAGLPRGGLTRDDLARDDPWNTYVRPGLPPGPICSPGRASLEAAVSPAPVDFLYFVAVGDGSGTHRFSTDWAGHERNVALYRRARRAAGPAVR